MIFAGRVFSGADSSGDSSSFSVLRSFKSFISSEVASLVSSMNSWSANAWGGLSNRFWAISLPKRCSVTTPIDFDFDVDCVVLSAADIFEQVVKPLCT